MEPIIDPMFFYWCGVCGFVSSITLVLAILLTAGSTITFFIGFADDDVDAREVFKVLLPLMLVLWSVAIFTPSKDTLILMQVAKNVTPDNVQSLKQLTGGVREAVKADIIDIIETMTREGEKSQ